MDNTLRADSNAIRAAKNGGFSNSNRRGELNWRFRARLRDRWEDGMPLVGGGHCKATGLDESYLILMTLSLRLTGFHRTGFAGIEALVVDVCG